MFIQPSSGLGHSVMFVLFLSLDMGNAELCCCLLELILTQLKANPARFVFLQGACPAKNNSSDKFSYYLIYYYHYHHLIILRMSMMLTNWAWLCQVFHWHCLDVSIQEILDTESLTGIF